MPRKKRVQTITEEKKQKKNIMNTMINENTEDHIILQLPINKNNINNITNIDINTIDPIPYDDKECYFYSDNKIIDMSFDNLNRNKDDNVIDSNYNETVNKVNTNIENKSCCFWCIHSIEYMSYGMPMSHDFHTNTYSCHGSFCSLECANAYNFSINSGSDKVWEINSLIQMMAKLYNLKIPVRPAPSRYLLNIFNGGTISIEEYRELHKTTDTSYVLNLPPMVSIISTYEKINTSYIKSLTENIKKTNITQHLSLNEGTKKINIFKNKN
tara:strand:+ start:80 stop:889 length:810 start_codon:yes stop_codon:yes gene_type:complete